ncbi:MAG: helix-turn-helix transcriptional regulator [bacterium]|nr:helix-turn-helix transcriptional regulator [bacterium]
MTLTKSETTLTNILAHARSLFLTKSYAEVTMSRIAAEAGLTKGALYHHFTGKQELYLAMMHAGLEQHRRLHQEAVESTGSVWDRLGALTTAFLELPREERDLVTLVRRDINVFSEPERSELVRAYQRCLPEQVEAIVSAGTSSGELEPTDARLAAWHFVALVEVCLTPYAEDLFASPQAKAAHVLKLFSAGASARS